MRRAKIVCTLGPASSDAALIGALIEAGMDCARLNFSHGTHASHQRTADMVRKAAQRAGRPVALLADLCGPKIRTGLFSGGPVELVPGREFTLTAREVDGDATQVAVTYKALPQDVEAGDQILIDDGLLRLEVVAVEGPDIRCRVAVGGTLSGGKGINIPGRALSTAAMTPKDEADLEFAVGTLEVEFAALSFVRTAADVQMAQRLARGTPIIAKLEKPEAIANLTSIADIAEGCMVARGDLGVELGAEKVPLVQKRIIREINKRGKLVITATQMLDSMIRNPTPTRAEAADVANAVLDGTDALMLSGETAAGRYPVEAVRMMDRIIREVETAWLLEDHAVRDVSLMEDWGFANAAAKAAALMSYALPLKAIVVFTRDGRTANLLSEFRPRAPIVAVTPKRHVAARLALEWGVIPRVDVPPDNLGEIMRIASGILGREGLCHEGDAFAVVMGWPPEGGTNTVKLHQM
jgi:pyruvate kinase